MDSIGILPILGIVLAFVIFLAIRYRSLAKKREQKSEDFWAREREGNLSVRRDIDLEKLPYLKVPLSKFPSDAALLDDTTYMSYIAQLEAMSHERMLNLSGKTNTDLKLEYGINNLDTMQKVGDNYISLTVLLIDIAKHLMAIERFEDAITVLEYGVSIGSDISANYTLLGDCYLRVGRPKKITDLIDLVKSRGFVMERSILKHLNSLLPDEMETEDFKVHPPEVPAETPSASSHTDE